MTEPASHKVVDTAATPESIWQEVSEAAGPHDPPGVLDTAKGRAALDEVVGKAHKAVDPRLPQSLPFRILRRFWPGNFVDAWCTRPSGARMWQPWEWWWNLRPGAKPAEGAK